MMIIEKIDRERAADFMIVSVTKVETDAIDSLLQPISPQGEMETEVEGHKYKLGKIGEYNVVCCRCETPGTIGSNSATLTIAAALQDWPNVKGVFMPGICYGLKKEGDDAQRIGDVVASEKVFAYEWQEKGKEVKITKNKDTIFNADKNMVYAFEQANAVWNQQNLLGEETRAYKGSYVAGNTRYLAEAPIKELSEVFPQAIAGDMEGHGLAAACQKYKKPWLLMKGVSDFGKREEDNNERQKDAATASAKALLNILNDKESDHIRAIAPEGSVNYFYHGIKYKINNIFFRQYMPEVEEYYIERKIDKTLELLIKTGCIWVYGQSGMGKSTSISRVLMKSGIKYELCDLTSFSHSPIEDIFKSIYEKICMGRKDIPDPNLQTQEQITEGIFGVVRKHYPNSALYVLIEEIPFNFDSDQFVYFFEALNALIISSKLKLGNSRLEFVLSTIESPEPRLAQWQQKIKQMVRFIEMKRWTMEECLKLTTLLSSITDLKWTDAYKKETFIEEMGYSPALIKKSLNDIVSMGLETVEKEMVELVKML